MNPIFKKLEDISQENISHGSILKTVLMSNDELHNNLTQIAYGVFKPGQNCELHEHPTMYEYFFFIEGTGEYLVGDQKIKIQPHVLIEIPPRVFHKLFADQELKFLYWGISI